MAANESTGPLNSTDSQPTSPSKRSKIAESFSSVASFFSKNSNKSSKQASSPKSSVTQSNDNSSNNTNTLANEPKDDTDSKDSKDGKQSKTGLSNPLKGFKLGSNIKKLGQKIDDRLTMPGLLKQARVTLEYWLVMQSKQSRKQIAKDNDDAKSAAALETITSNEEKGELEQEEYVKIDVNDANDANDKNDKNDENDGSSEQKGTRSKSASVSDSKTSKKQIERDVKGVDRIDGIEVKLDKKPPFACGIVLMSTVAGGFVHGAEASTGIVLVRLDKGYETDVDDNPIQRWSQPCAVAGGGVSAGLQIGFSKIDQFIILTHPRHVKTFMGHGQVQLGARAEAAIGDKGASATGSVNISDKQITEMVSYTLKAKGLLAGIKVSISGMGVNKDVNAKYYGNKEIGLDEIFNDQMTFPPSNDDYDRIIEILTKYFPQYPPPNHPYFQDTDMLGILDVVNTTGSAEDIDSDTNAVI